MFEFLEKVLSPEFVNWFTGALFYVVFALPVIFVALWVLTPLVSALVYVIGGLAMVVIAVGGVAGAIVHGLYNAGLVIIKYVRDSRDADSATSDTWTH